MSYQKHLTFYERQTIEQELLRNSSFKQIALMLDKDPSTISKEIRKHRIEKAGQSIHIDFNHCAKKYSCTKKDICNTGCKNLCRKCNHCNSLCSEYVEDVCFKLTHAPYVCNGCSQKYSCKRTKYYYKALSSDNAYRKVLSESRQGANLDEFELCKLDSIISPLVKNGQSISHIAQTHDFNCTRQTLYNYMRNNYFSVRNIDLPRAVKLKKRKSHKQESKDSKIRQGRTYEDFKAYLEKYPETQVVEMDTVEGTKGGKVLLTFLFRNTRFMLAFLLNSKTSNEVLNVFNKLEMELGNELFERMFSVILTDNGTEFSNPKALEFNDEGVGRTRIFFCDPQASYQKGMIEKNHEFIRYVLPKGTSFNNLVQEDIDLMLSHINSLTRESLNWQSPYKLAEAYLGKKVLKKLNISKVSASNVQLNTKLLKKK
mgnify:CR=1 FL=1